MTPAAEQFIDSNTPHTVALCNHSPRQKRNRFLALALWILLLASACLCPATSTHVGSTDTHGTIEWVGALFALVVGLAMITRLYALGDRMHLFIGLAFFVNGMEGFVHGLLSLAGRHQWLGAGHVALTRFIPRTYLTGRFLFGALLILAHFTLRLFGPTPNPKRPQDKLAEYKEHLEEVVETRTRQLENGNRTLQQEIDQRKEAQAGLHAGQEQLRITLASIGDGVIATDTNRRITRLNRMADAQNVRSADTLLKRADKALYKAKKSRP